MKKYIRADFRSDHKAALARGRDKKKNRILNQIKESDNPIVTAFNLLVPSSGKADTVAGEVVRAINQILYRDINDGDVFYEGYGIETCGDAVAFLCEKFPNLKSAFERIALGSLTDDQYTESLENIASSVMENIYENPDLLSQKNTEDMYDYNGEDFIRDMGWIPEYEISLYYPDNILDAIEKGDLSPETIQSEVQYWDGLDTANVEASYNDVYISGIDRETYEELEMYGESYLAQMWDEYEE